MGLPVTHPHPQKLVSRRYPSMDNLIIANRKSTTRFPTSYTWSPYDTLTFPKGELKSELKNKFPFISVIDEGSDFQFGMQLRFAKVYHQIPLDEKAGVALG